MYRIGKAVFDLKNQLEVPGMSKIRKALREPGEILLYLRRRLLLRRLLISQVEEDGQSYFRYKGHLYPTYLDNKAASPNIFSKAKQYCTGVGIDVGGGKNPFSDATLVEDEECQNAYLLDTFPDHSLDYVFSSHCLEHLERWQEALDLWISKIKPGGVLFLYLPHAAMPFWQPQGLWVGSCHKWSPSVEILLPYLGDKQMDVLDYNPDKDNYWSFHIAAQKPSGMDNPRP